MAIGLATSGDHGINTALNNGSLSYASTDAATQFTVTEGTKIATVNLGASNLTDNQALGID